MTNLVRLAAATPLLRTTDDFWFLRHGETDGNRLRVYQPRDQPLNERGLGQAALAAQVLATQGIERIVASDLTRCRQTAGIVSETLRVQPSFTEGLREKWFGDWVGQSSANLDWDTPPPNGEILADFVARTCDALQKALTTDRRTLIVAHGGTLHVLGAALGIAVEQPQIVNATPLRFRRDAGRWLVEVLAVIGDPAASTLS